VFDVDPGGKTTMTFTYYHTSAWSGSGAYPTPLKYDSFTATRTRSDGFGFRRRHAMYSFRAALRGRRQARC
jgi:hypothetical protein